MCWGCLVITTTSRSHGRASAIEAGVSARWMRCVRSLSVTRDNHPGHNWRSRDVPEERDTPEGAARPHRSFKAWTSVHHLCGSMALNLEWKEPSTLHVSTLHGKRELFQYRKLTQQGGQTGTSKSFLATTNATKHLKVSNLVNDDKIVRNTESWNSDLGPPSWLYFSWRARLTKQCDEENNRFVNVEIATGLNGCGMDTTCRHHVVRRRPPPALRPKN